MKDENNPAIKHNNHNILVEPFTRLKQSASGFFSPGDLPGLADYLASPDGKLQYHITGSQFTDDAGNQKRKLTCIISGLILLHDPAASEPVPFTVDIASRLIVVGTEAELPPLEEEAEDEDYIVAGSEVDPAVLVTEEIILNLPMMPRSGFGRISAGENVTNPSPFARLAELKKTSS